MNRSNYFNYIENKLSYLAFRIERRGKINLLELNIHSETFFADLINLIFDCNLINLNVIKPNVEGIDLIDKEKEIIAQVSSTNTKQKVEDTLGKEVFKKYSGYRFKFIVIAQDADKLKKSTFKNPYNALFVPGDDILDIDDINTIVLHMPIKEQKIIYHFIQQELGNEIDIVKIDSNMASILNILASEHLDDNLDSPEINPFAIDEKIIYNDLMSIKDTIDEYKIFYHKLDEKYAEFDRQGANKSMSIFRILKILYIKLLPAARDSRDLFFMIVDAVKDIILESKNYIELPYEEMEMCVNIIVVDSFIRCKIFKNPEGYNHVITG